jgi:NAD(P)-dependent dehydrogenase (short-subunit alcohol dehydrogenase family)
MMRMQRSATALAPAASALAGRVVLVTGACGGLGAEVSRCCARAAATVVLLGRRVPALERLYDELVALGAPTPAIYPLDLAGATAEHYAELRDAILRECGRLDGIVHAAARFDGLAPLDCTPPAEWLATLTVDLAAPAQLTQACLPLLQRQSDAALVFVFDDPDRVQRAYWGAYAVAKGGLMSFATVLADELENSSVRVHGLLPPPLRTRLRGKAYVGDKPEDCEAPLRTAEACVFLLSAAAVNWRGITLDLRPI